MFESERHNRLRPYEVQLKKFSYQQVSEVLSVIVVVVVVIVVVAKLL